MIATWNDKHRSQNDGTIAVQTLHGMLSEKLDALETHANQHHVEI